MHSTRRQARLIARYVKDVIITYDSDGAGVKAAIRAIPILKSAGIRTKILKLTPYKDPDELIKAVGREEYEERIKNAENSFNFELSNLEKSYDLTEPEGKTEFLNKVADRLTEFEEELERENYIAAVADRYFVSKDALKSLVNKIGGAKEIREIYKDAGERIKKADRAKTADEGLLKTNRLLLSLIADKPDLYNRIKNIISARDFATPLYKDLALRIFTQIEEGKKPNAAEIISRYESGEDQSLVTAVFEESLEAEVDEAEREKAFKEIVVKVKRAGLEEELKSIDSKDMKSFMEITKKQRELGKLDF